MQSFSYELGHLGTLRRWWWNLSILFRSGAKNKQTKVSLGQNLGQISFPEDFRRRIKTLTTQKKTNKRFKWNIFQQVHCSFSKLGAWLNMYVKPHEPQAVTWIWFHQLRIFKTLIYVCITLCNLIIFYARLFFFLIHDTQCSSQLWRWQVEFYYYKPRIVVIVFNSFT